MIDQVAKAIEAAFNDCGRVFDEDQATWLAEAAVKAMREPTEEMTTSGLDAVVHTRLGVDSMRMGYQAMIDCLLNTPSNFPAPE